jgi:hypothetical protein
MDMATNAIRHVGSSSPADDYSSDEDDLAQKKLTDRIKQLAIDPAQQRFFGKSSGVTLIRTAIDLKKEITGNDHNVKIPHLASKRPEFWNLRSVSLIFFLSTLIFCRVFYVDVNFSVVGMVRCPTGVTADLHLSRQRPDHFPR